MKKIFSAFMIAICCLAMAMPAQAQLIKFGVKGGLNLSKLSFSKEAKDNLNSDNTPVSFSVRWRKLQFLLLVWEWMVLCYTRSEEKMIGSSKVLRSLSI